MIENQTYVVNNVWSPLAGFVDAFKQITEMYQTCFVNGDPRQDIFYSKKTMGITKHVFFKIVEAAAAGYSLDKLINMI